MSREYPPNYPPCLALIRFLKFVWVGSPRLSADGMSQCPAFAAAGGLHLTSTSGKVTVLALKHLLWL